MKPNQYVGFERQARILSGIIQQGIPTKLVVVSAEIPLNRRD